MAKRTGQVEDAKDKTDAGGEGTTFEMDLKRLEEIVRALEAGDLPLEKALALYEEGRGLSKRCERRLDQADARIEALQEKDGRVEKTKFETE